MSKTNKPKPYAPEAFPWHENKVQASLQKLVQVEAKIPQQVVEIMTQLLDSHLYWQIFSAYTDAMEACEGNSDKENIVQRTMFARLYIAGSHHGNSINMD